MNPKYEIRNGILYLADDRIAIKVSSISTVSREQREIEGGVKIYAIILNAEIAVAFDSPSLSADFYNFITSAISDK
jgi:hypothetical protein